MPMKNGLALKQVRLPKPPRDSCPRCVVRCANRGLATNTSEGSKARLHHTKHPNALPASWHCPGQPGQDMGKLFHFCSCRIAFGNGCDCRSYVSAMQNDKK